MRDRRNSTIPVRSVLLAAMVFATGLLAGCSGGQAAPAESDPLTVDEVAHISRQEVQAGIADKSLVVVDTLPADMHKQVHLPGAINIPGHPYEIADASTDAHAPRLLPDKNAKIALYCINVPCRNSEFVGRRLMELGYTHVTKYAEGIEDWMQADLPVEGTAVG